MEARLAVWPPYQTHDRVEAEVPLLALCTTFEAMRLAQVAAVDSALCCNLCFGRRSCLSRALLGRTPSITARAPP